MATGLCIWNDHVLFPLAYFMVYSLILLGVYDVSSVDAQHWLHMRRALRDAKRHDEARKKALPTKALTVQTPPRRRAEPAERREESKHAGQAARDQAAR